MHTRVQHFTNGLSSTRPREEPKGGVEGSLMRLREYYSRIVQDGRRGRPSIDEVRVDYRRDLKRRVDADLSR